MAKTISSKRLSERDANQVLQAAANLNDNSLNVSGFVNAKVGHRITFTNVQSSPAIDDYRFLDMVNTETGTTTNGSAVITGVTNAVEDIQVGQYVFGTGIPANTTVLSVDSNTQITLSANATASASVSIRFGNLLYRIRVEYDTGTRDNVVDVERLD